MKSPLAVLGLWTAVSAATLAGQVDSTTASRTLTGLRGVHVVVGEAAEAAERHGVSEAQIRSDVELQLQQAGIVVLTKDDLRRVPGMPLLFVSAEVAPSQETSTVYAYHVVVELLQLIVLTRNPELFSLGRTWSANGGLGAVGADSLGASVKASVHAMTDQFVTACLAANPKH